MTHEHSRLAIGIGDPGLSVCGLVEFEYFTHGEAFLQASLGFDFRRLTVFPSGDAMHTYQRSSLLIRPLITMGLGHH